MQGDGSRSLGDAYQIYFSNDFYFNFMLGLVDFSDLAILCHRPNNFVNKISIVLMSLYFP